MAKFYGAIGFANTVEVRPGVWDEQIEERNYCGELIRDTYKNQSSGQVIDDITIASQISILSDPFADKNFHRMLYVVYMGTKWKITSIEPKYPRLILGVGGVYNG